MQTHQDTRSVSADARLAFVDITDEVQQVIRSCSVTNGRVTVLRAQDGYALVLNEKEKGLHADVQAAIERLAESDGENPPPVGSASVVLPVVDGRAYLGTWQRILMLELEAPRRRPLLIQVVGE